MLLWDCSIIDYSMQVALYFCKKCAPCVQGRTNVVKILRQVIEKRRAASPAATYDDMLEHLVRDALNDEEIIDQIITILYSGYETVSTTSMMVVKYLHDNQQALQELRVKDYFFPHVSWKQTMRTNNVVTGRAFWDPMEEGSGGGGGLGRLQVHEVHACCKQFARVNSYIQILAKIYVTS